MGGAHRTPVTPGSETGGRSVWPVVGTVVVAALLLFPVVWLVVLAGRAMNRFGGSGVDWMYAGLLVLVLAVAVWLFFRLVRQNRSGS